MDDKIGNLYRAAFYIAKGAKEVGLDFLKKSGRKFGNVRLTTQNQRIILAEKILDEYIRIKYSI